MKCGFVMDAQKNLLKNACCMTGGFSEATLTDFPQLAYQCGVHRFKRGRRSIILLI